MSEENVVRLCAPTLAGIKTGSLFPCPYECRETLLMEIRQYNQVLVPERALPPAAAIHGKERAAVSVPPARSGAGSAGPVGSGDPAARGLCLRQQRAVSDAAHRAAARVRRIPARDRPVSELSAGGRQRASSSTTRLISSTPASGRCTATSSGRAISLQNTSAARRSIANVCTRARALRSSP